MNRNYFSIFQFYKNNQLRGGYLGEPGVQLIPRSPRGVLLIPWGKSDGYKIVNKYVGLVYYKFWEAGAKEAKKC